jgi:hypothetical protein
LLIQADASHTQMREEWVGTSWIVEGVTTGLRDGKPSEARHLFLISLLLISLRTTPEARMRQVRDRCKH